MREGETYYHGSSSSVLKGNKILPPSETNIIQEKGRKKNLDRVFFTRDIGSARIYAGRAAQRFGGRPIVVRAIPMGEIETLNDKDGTTVYHSPWAFHEPLEFREWICEHEKIRPPKVITKTEEIMKKFEEWVNEGSNMGGQGHLGSERINLARAIAELMYDMKNVTGPEWNFNEAGLKNLQDFEIEEMHRLRSFLDKLLSRLGRG